MKNFIKSFLPAYFVPGTKKIRPSKWVALVFLLILGLVPLHFTATGNTWLVKLLTTTNIFAIFAISWDILSGYTGQENFGHHFFVGVGAFLVGLFTIALVRGSTFGGITYPPLINFQLPVPVLILFAGVLSAVFGVLIGIPCLKLAGPYLALATLAMGLIFHEFVDKILPGLHPNLKAHATESIRGIENFAAPIPFYYIILVVTILSLIIIYSFSRSHYGLVLKAIKKDEPAAKAMGINTTRYKVAIFAGSAFFAGIAGAFLAYALNAISAVDVESNLTIKIISMCIVGGMGTISGSFGGAYFLMALMWGLNEISRTLSDLTGIAEINAAYKIFEDIFYYGAIIIVLLFLPHGVIATIIKKMDKIKARLKRLVSRRSS